MNRIRLSKFFVFLVVSLFILSYFAQVKITTSAAQPEDEWVAYPMHISQLADPLVFSGYSPSQIRAAYGLPSSGGAGTTIAIIDAYYTPSVLNDLTVFSNQFSLPPPTASNFEVHNMSTTLSTANSNWAEETCLDVEWAHAIAPDAKILLVEAKNNFGSNLLSAVDYARNRPDVVAVSMSWGSPEVFGNTNYDSNFTSNHGVAFFASSGDNGAQVNWPANSPNVVAVGGTTLNFNPDGTVNETAWSGSGGGISQYEAKPAYQTSYGVNASKRAVPDVSYDANPSTGVSVYCNSSWYKVGGTSAGAPQWAAIHALGLSATNANLYQKAKLAYSSYFRDIISGSNGGFNATSDYDYVTGLGSPLTCDFSSLTVSPTSGPPGGLITLSGIGFTVGSSVNISYLNPSNSTWVPIVNNWATDSPRFTYNMTAPDLLRNNPANDSQPIFDNIVFRAQDNSTGNSYNTTIPYTEWRRGLTQIGNAAATGLFGNNTNLATSAFVQNSQSIVVAGKWFSPGTASLLWDGTISLGTGTTDATGLLNATVLVPTTSAGQHTLTINDGVYGVSNFCVNLTRLPAVTNDYDGLWHVTDFPINLTPDYNVNETFYSINNGSVCNVTANGQPVITTEGSNNTLEYWSTWDIYGTGTMELPHVTLTGIELDKTAPTGSITTSSNVDTTTITLSLYATDSVSGVAQMRFSNSNGEWSSWEPYATSKTWTLQNGDGQKTVTVQYIDNAGLISSQYSCTVIFDISETSNPSLLATSSPSPTPSESPSPEPSATPAVPELSIQMILVLLAVSTLSLAVKYKEKRQKNEGTHECQGGGYYAVAEHYP